MLNSHTEGSTPGDLAGVVEEYVTKWGRLVVWDRECKVGISVSCGTVHCTTTTASTPMAGANHCRHLGRKMAGIQHSNFNEFSVISSDQQLLNKSIRPAVKILKKEI